MVLLKLDKNKNLWRSFMATADAADKEVIQYL